MTQRAAEDVGFAPLPPGVPADCVVVAPASSEAWVSTTPLGVPVVPEVWMIQAGSCGERGGPAVTDGR